MSRLTDLPCISIFEPSPPFPAQAASVRAGEADSGAVGIRQDGAAVGGGRDRDGDQDEHHGAVGGQAQRQGRPLPIHARGVHRGRHRLGHRGAQLMDRMGEYTGALCNVA